MVKTTNDDLGVFLRRAMSDKNVSQYDLADVVGKTQAWINTYLLRKPEATLKRLFMNDPDTFNAVCRKIGVDPAEVLHRLGLYAKPNADIINLKNAIPVFPAGAGPALDDKDAVEHVIITDKNGGSFRVFGLKIVGQSMEPYLNPGEVAVIAAEPSLVEPGDACAVYMPDSGHIVKNFVRSLNGNSFLLESLNPPPGTDRYIVAPPGSRIIGKVIKRIKND